MQLERIYLAKEEGLFEEGGMGSVNDDDVDVHINLWNFWVIEEYNLILYERVNDAIVGIPPHV